MTENDKRKPGFYKASPEAIPPYQAAIAQYQNPAKHALIGMIKGGNDIEWDYWKATIEQGRRSEFDTILDFFVNVPSLQDQFADEAVTKAWYWNEIEPTTLSSQFYYRPELLRMLRSSAGADAMISDGWLVKYVTGRIDAETTWADTSYLIGTKDYFAYIHLYLVIIH
jgi:hypothetical protein